MADSIAPPGLTLVRDFINSIDLAPDVNDDWTDPAALARWLVERELLDASARVTDEDLLRARQVREALRALCIANAGGEADDGALQVIQAAADSAELTLRFAPDRAWLEPRGHGIDAVVGRVLALVAAAMADGTWSRMKACRADDCLWAFYDTSRNRSGAWCSMSSCGNRAKARAYRTRQRTK